MKNLALLLFLLVAVVATAQTEDENTEFPNSNTSYVTFDISTPINIVTPRYRFGYVQAISRNWKIGFDFGYGDYYTTWKAFDNNDDKDEYRLFEGRTEVYHILNPTNRVNMYVSGEVYYVHHQEVYYDDYFRIKDSDIEVDYDRADLTRMKYGFNLKYGVFVPFGEKVGMNAFIGGGPRIRDIEFTDIVNPDTSYDYHDDEFGFLDHVFRREGRYYGFNFALGVKFVYQIK